MLKKLFITAAAAAAVSVPLAGVAWADPPSDPDSSSNPTNPEPNNPPGQGDVPQEIGSLADNYNVNPIPANRYSRVGIQPGKRRSKGTRSRAKTCRLSTPEAYGAFGFIYCAAVGSPAMGGPHPSRAGRQTFTPGCSSGVI